mgnify:CR=1 FL=1
MPKTLEVPNRVVVALGGNALGDTPEEQIERANNTAKALIGLIEQGNEIIITHGNGPQVGMIQNAFAAAHDAINTPAMDLPECGAIEPRLHWLSPAAGDRPRDAPSLISAGTSRPS